MCFSDFSALEAVFVWAKKAFQSHSQCDLRFWILFLPASAVKPKKAHNPLFSVADGRKKVFAGQCLVRMKGPLERLLVGKWFLKEEFPRRKEAWEGTTKLGR